jgi:alpha-amylase
MHPFLSVPLRTRPKPAPRRRLRATLAALSLIATAPASADVLLHAFNWKYDDVAARAQEIADAGYRIVLVAPAYRSEGSAWWSRYQPQDWRVIHHALGDTTDFRDMANALDARGVRVYADIVFNHMANEAATRTDLNYPGQRVLAEYAANPAYFGAQRLFGNLQQNLLGSVPSSDFGPSICINDYGSVFQVQNYRLCMGAGDVGLPDLQGNDWIVAQQKAYLTALKAMKVKGFRIDAAKHMKLAHINAVFDAGIKSGTHVFGEVITGGGVGNGEYDKFLAPYLSGTDHAAYDFPLHAQMRAAFAPSGSMSLLVDPGAYGQALPGTRAFTFTVTHDMPLNSIFRGMLMDAGDETLAYAFIMGRDGGVPMVYTDQNESGDNRWVDAWKRADLKAMIGFHNAAQGNDMQVLSHGACHLIFRRGNRGIVAINKCGSTVNASVGMSNSVLWWYTDYRDALGSGSVVNIRSSSYTFTLPARTARMWLR